MISTPVTISIILKGSQLDAGSLTVHTFLLSQFEIVILVLVLHFVVSE